MKSYFNLLRQRYELLLVSLILGILPFFWLQPNEMDLGGDETRLYFLTPLTYLQNYTLTLVHGGIGVIDPHYYAIPYILFIAFLRYFFSPYIVISLFNSIKLVGGFLGIYLVVRELLVWNKQKYTKIVYYAAIIAGLLYVCNPYLLGDYDRALIVQNQVFLNPLVFYLILKFLLTSSYRYGWLFVFTSFIFAPNFSWIAAPAVVSFYSLSIIFLVLYARYIRKTKIRLRALVVLVIFFIGLQMFQFIPTIAGLSSGVIAQRTFIGNGMSHLLDYFTGVLPLSLLSTNFFLPTSLQSLVWLTLLPFFIIMIGFLLSKKDRTLALTGIFFLVAFYFISAKIGNIGIEIYKLLFYIPGFSMFRDFTGQWFFTYSFFYAIVFGQSLFYVLSYLGKKRTLGLCLLLVGICIIDGWPLLSSSAVKKTLFQSNNVKNVIVMDPHYLIIMDDLRSLPNTGKVLIFPFSDYNYQVISGLNNGAYVGSSTVLDLSGKKDFAGYMDMAPFSDTFYQLAKEKNYSGIKELLAMLNIDYLFVNQSPKAYDTTFPSYPFQYVRTYLPQNQQVYAHFIQHIVGKRLFQSGSYSIYAIGSGYQTQHIFALNNIATKSSEVVFTNNTYSQNVGNIDASICTSHQLSGICTNKKIFKELPTIHYQMINPTKYIITASNIHNNYILALLDMYSNNWILTKYTPQNNVPIFSNIINIDEASSKPLAQNRHFLINGYANAWYIHKDEVGKGDTAKFILEIQNQEIFYIGAFISLISLVIFVVWGIVLLRKQIALHK